MKWIWHWKDKNGETHMTHNREEADRALHQGCHVIAERADLMEIKNE